MTSNHSISSISPETIPDSLKSLDRWICWKYRQRDGTKDAKVPVDPRGHGTPDITAQKSWCPFEVAYENHTDESTNTNGLGFMFTAYDPLVGIDLDDCVTEGKLASWASDIVGCVDSYTEFSPSGTGVHIIAAGVLPEASIRADSLEAYSNERYFTVTGNHVTGTSREVAYRTERLEAVCSEYTAGDSEPQRRTRPQTAVSTGGGNSLSDEEVLEKAQSAANGEKFRRLWSGVTSGYPSQSEADLALCNMLAFWTGGDAEQVDRLFRASGLMRPKWDEKRGEQTYGDLTIQEAFNTTDDYYRA